MTDQTEDRYDVFVSYSHTDQAWVHNELLPRLEAAGLKVIIDDRDFEIGVPSLVNMERAVETSRHTLIVLTPAWIQSEWAEFESLLVVTADPAARRRKLIPLLLKPCALPSRISILTYADFTDLAKREGEITRLLGALGGHVHMGKEQETKVKEQNCQRDLAIPSPIEPQSITQSDLDELSDLLSRSGRAAPSARRALCIKIGIEPDDLDFITGPANRDFALQLVSHLQNTENFPALLSLCDAITPIIRGPLATKLAMIRAKI